MSKFRTDTAVAKLEDLLEQLQEQSQTGSRISGTVSTSPAFDENSRSASALLRSFERELRKFNNASSSINALNQDVSDFAEASVNNEAGQRKRKRLDDSTEAFDWGIHLLGHVLNEDDGRLSSTGLLQQVINNYFSQVHPWIPMIHENSFRKQFAEQVQQTNLEVILHAMIVAALRFASNNGKIRNESALETTRTSRDWVILNATKSLSVENLQALTIVAFNDIGDGNASCAWSIVGSLTRTVEYLQLSVEAEEDMEQPLLKPCPLLSDPKNWTEMETRRRVFWSIFNLDRFCSVVTGWNTSLTSDDVYQRLPADGALWRKQEHVLTPYFGIWDKSAGRIGNSIAYLPTHYPSPTHGSDHQSPASARVGDSNQIQADLGTPISTIGAFALCIEATESMSRVTTYFLQQKANLQDQKQVGSWLTRFKELDLRLVHWKMFLPQQWKDTNISRRPAEVIMDPNLTLAHITHNASMILLHQVIAYPSTHWDWASKLPSRWSADTCQAAAVETSSITENYLKSPTKSKIVNSQFAFCVFVAARVLLVHWRHYDASPAPEFAKLLSSLSTMSICWKGERETQSGPPKDIAAKYADQLRALQHRCTNNPDFRIDVMGYAKELGASHADSKSDSKEIHMAFASRPGQQKKRKFSRSKFDSGPRTQRRTEGIPSPNCHREGGASERVPATLLPDSLDFQLQDQNIQSGFIPNLSSGHRVNSSPAYPAVTHLVTEGNDGILSPAAGFQATEDSMSMNDLNPISQMFIDQQFLEMDRVISYDDGLFSANMGWWGQES
ncbi:hypothetical protein IFR05_004834 [Cadophora sp. M221]|nr:hypothetical protein IFR05_004834 [Cadophora sp. M221]